MKLLIVPDIHGLHSWIQPVKKAIKHRDIHIIFIGDFVDSFDVPGYKILQNLRDIIALKKKFPERITLLLGNHDYAYIHNLYVSGFNSSMMHSYKELFEKHKNLFQAAWGFQGKTRYTLITHAGLTQTFYNMLQKRIEDKENIMHLLLVKDPVHDYKYWHQIPLHEILNYFKDQKESMWSVSSYRGGTNLSGSILWADKKELIADRFKGIDQIVGHTNQLSIHIKQIDEDILYFIDATTSNNLSLFSIDLE